MWPHVHAGLLSVAQARRGGRILTIARREQSCDAAILCTRQASPAGSNHAHAADVHGSTTKTFAEQQRPVSNFVQLCVVDKRFLAHNLCIPRNLDKSYCHGVLYYVNEGLFWQHWAAKLHRALH